MTRLPNETMQQYRGRQKREMNAANDALNLQVGEPIQIGGRKTRFQLRLIDRKRPSRIIRLEGEELAKFLLEEELRNAELEQRAKRQRDRDAFFARPEVRAADTVRAMLESDLETFVAKLHPSEWIALAEKLSAA